MRSCLLSASAEEGERERGPGVGGGWVDCADKDKSVGDRFTLDTNQLSWTRIHPRCLLSHNVEAFSF